MARDVEVEFEDSEAYRRVKHLLEGSEDWSIECATSYSAVVEFGAGPAISNAPFMPPLEPIKEWARRKIPVETRSRRVRDGVFVEERVGNRRMKEDEAEKAAEAIRWKIYHEGLEPQPFARPAIHDLQVEISGVVDKALREGEEPMHAVMEFVRDRMRHHIDQNGTNNEGTPAREMYIVHPDGRREKCRPSVKAPARRSPWMRPSGQRAATHRRPVIHGAGRQWGWHLSPCSVGPGRQGHAGGPPLTISGPPGLGTVAPPIALTMAVLAGCGAVVQGREIRSQSPLGLA